MPAGTGAFHGRDTSRHQSCAGLGQIIHITFFETQGGLAISVFREVPEEVGKLCKKYSNT